VIVGPDERAEIGRRIDAIKPGSGITVQEFAAEHVHQLHGDDV
jgi:hypothetical protein